MKELSGDCFCAQMAGSQRQELALFTTQGLEKVQQEVCPEGTC